MTVRSVILSQHTTAPKLMFSEQRIWTLLWTI